MTGPRGSVGCEVPAPDGEIRHGHVQAVFARSAHVFADGRFLTLGGPGLAAHPCSLLYPGYSGDLVVGQEVVVSSTGLWVGGSRSAAFDDLDRFTPVRETRPMAGKDRIAQALAASRARLIAMPSRGGFHAVLIAAQHCGGPDRPSYLADGFARTGARSCSALCRALAARDGHGFARAASGLAGMGVGLTPAGDDLLAGVLSALRFHARSTGDAVFPPGQLEQLASAAGRLTSPFSAFLLAGAAKGLVAEPLAHWLEAVCRGMGDLALAKIPEIGALGHSSGLDTLTGMVLALQTVEGEDPWLN